MRVSTLASLDASTLAVAFNAVYEGYVESFTMSDDAARRHVDAHDISLARSPLWLDDRGDVVGLAALGVRGERGWVGGFGIAPAHRGRGLGHRLVDELLRVAHDAAVRRLQLEVFTHNPVAIRLYEGSGFRRRRDLLILRREAAPLPDDGNAYQFEGNPRHLLAQRAALSPVEPAWQREPASLVNVERRQALVHGDTAGPAGYLVFVVAETALHLLDIAAHDAGVARGLLGALAARHPDKAMLLVNEPEDSPALAALAATGWRETLRQHEMVYHLR